MNSPVMLLFSLMACLLIPSCVPAQEAARRWDVAASGAIADGKTDCTAVFQRLLDAAGKAGGWIWCRLRREDTGYRVIFPFRRTRLFRASTEHPERPARRRDRTLPAPCCSPMPGAAEIGPPFIRLAGNNSAIAGFVITYPEWKQTDVPPVPYPPCVLSETHGERRRERCCLSESLRGHQAGRRGAALDSQRHRLSDQARHLCGRVLRHRPHREHPLLAVWRHLQPRNPLLQMGEHRRAWPSSWRAPTGTTCSTRSASATAWATSSPARRTAAPTATSSGSAPTLASGRWWWSRRSRPAC